MYIKNTKTVESSMKKKININVLNGDTEEIFETITLAVCGDNIKTSTIDFTGDRAGDINRTTILADSQKNYAGITNPLLKRDNSEEYVQGQWEAGPLTCLLNKVMGKDTDGKPEFITCDTVCFAYQDENNNYCGFSILLSKKRSASEFNKRLSDEDRSVTYAIGTITNCEKLIDNKAKLYLANINIATKTIGQQEITTEDMTSEILTSINEPTIRKIIKPLFKQDSSIDTEYFDFLHKKFNREKMSIQHANTAQIKNYTGERISNRICDKKKLQDASKQYLSKNTSITGKLATTAMGINIITTAAGYGVSTAKCAAFTGLIFGHGLWSLPAAAIGALTGFIMGCGISFILGMFAAAYYRIPHLKKSTKGHIAEDNAVTADNALVGVPHAAI